MSCMYHRLNHWPCVHSHHYKSDKLQSTWLHLSSTWAKYSSIHVFAFSQNLQRNNIHALYAVFIYV